jgi:hypothetical protein
MSTADSAEAFEQLVSTRNRLNELTRKLNEAHSAAAAPGSSGGLKEADNRYKRLQGEWDEAFHEFESATEAFGATVKKLREEESARRSERKS